MALPPSGTIMMSQVNTELTRPATGTILLGETAVRALAGKPSGVINMSDLWGKSSFTLGFSNLPADSTCVSGGQAYLAWYADGSITARDVNGYTNGSWGTPVGGTPGANYEIRISYPSIYQLAVNPYGSGRAWDTWYSMDGGMAIYTDVSTTVQGYTKFLVTIRHKITLASISKDFSLTCSGSKLAWVGSTATFNQYSSGIDPGGAAYVPEVIYLSNGGIVTYGNQVNTGPGGYFSPSVSGGGSDYQVMLTFGTSGGPGPKITFGGVTYAGGTLNGYSTPWYNLGVSQSLNTYGTTTTGYQFYTVYIRKISTGETISRDGIIQRTT